MRRYLSCIVVIAGFAATPAAVLAADSGPPAKAPIEEVIVTGSRTGATLTRAIDDFVGSHATTTQVLGKIARWKDGICPYTIGFRPELNSFITARIKQVAAMVGAPVQAKDACKVNVLVIVNPEPQLFLDSIRAKYPHLLGYSDGPRQTRRLATVSHPIQAWYTTQTRDVRGYWYVDSSDQCGGDPCTMFGVASHINSGMSSEFINVTIVADADKIIGYQAGSVADYIAMLVLAQTKSFDACQDLPTITNLMSSGCGANAKPVALTETDTAYLRALYRMEPSDNLNLQKGSIASQMQKNLEQKVGLR